MINYRYAVVEKIGEGGSGEVYLAEDTLRRNQQVAIKIILPSNLSGAEANEAFQNEVSSLIDLSHPNLVRIFDCGTIHHAEPASWQQRRFFTMEYVRGSDSLEWMSSLSNQPEKESLLELLLLQALSVLSYIHHEGVTHFDIKPQNLVLVGERKSTVSPLLKLMDFGFSRKQNESLDISIRGTLEYTPPELLKGEQHDHRVDLYSLGATFFHLLEGHCPFEATNPLELAKKILSDDVAFATKTTNERSRLREVINALMQKEPLRRCNTAEEAARILITDMPNGNELFESYFGLSRKSKFVGRGEELKAIADAISSLTHEGMPWERSAITLFGVEGIGKTTLIKRGLINARANELPVYELESGQMDVPFGSIASVIDLIASDIRSFSERGKDVFVKHEGLLGLSRETNTRSELWGIQKEHTIELISRFIIECADVSPCVIVADNAQLLDESSASVLRTVVRDVRPHRLLLLAAETTGMPKVISAPIARELQLREFGPDEVLEMSSSVLGGSSIAEEVGSSIYQLYGGSPGIVVEALNAVSDLVPSEALHDVSLAHEYLANLESRLPRNIDDFLVARFQKLSRERQLILGMLSCFQFPARMDVLIRLLPFHRLRCADHIRFLQLEGFVAIGENGRVLSIRMKRLKDAIGASITTERTELHSLIASLLEQDFGSMDFTHLQELAYQFSACGSHEKASLYFEKAADEGAKLFALQRALQLYVDAATAAKRCKNAEREVLLEVKRASALFRAGSYREAIDLCRALNNCQQLRPHELTALSKVMGLSLSRLGEKEQAQEHINAALYQSTDEVERLELRQEVVGLQISAGHFKDAQKACLEQLTQAKALNNGRLMGAIYTDLGIATFLQDQFSEAVRWFAEALETYEGLGEKTQVINSMNNIANALSMKGDVAQAIDYLEKAFLASQEYGTLNQQAQIQNNLGIVHFRLRKYDKAKLFYSDARSKYERINSRIGLANATTNLGEVLLAEGEYEAALKCWSEAKALYALMENPHALAESCLHIANALSRLGDVDGMQAQLEEAENIIDGNALEMFRGKLHFLRGVAKLNQRELVAASESFETVRTLYGAEKANELLWLATLRLAESLMQQGNHAEAVTCVEEVLNNPEAFKRSHLIAEAEYMMGTLALMKPAVASKRAIEYFKSGIELIAKEPVTEITWKLAFALAREYYERGQHERAKEFLVKTKLILQFFLSHFTLPELREKYLVVDQKKRVLATIESILTKEKG